MNRRSFIRMISGAVAALAIHPADFLTPYSPSVQIEAVAPGALTKEMLIKSLGIIGSQRGQPDVYMFPPWLYGLYQNVLGEDK